MVVVELWYRLYSMEVKQENENIPKELKGTLEKHHRFFQEILERLPPLRYHEHRIEFIRESTPPNIRPYKYPH
jgi:hypothetical protein